MLSLYLVLLDTIEEKGKFEQLYLLYRQDMFKTAYSILKNDFEAEDAVHEAFIIVIKNLEKISEIKCPQTHAYLIIIVKNLALKIYNERKKRQYDESDYSEILDTIDVEEEIMFKLEQKELESILISLPENYYNILFLEQYMGLSLKDISESLGITYENAKKRLQRAKSKIMQLVKEGVSDAR